MKKLQWFKIGEIIPDDAKYMTSDGDSLFLYEVPDPKPETSVKGPAPDFGPKMVNLEELNPKQNSHSIGRNLWASYRGNKLEIFGSEESIELKEDEVKALLEFIGYAYDVEICVMQKAQEDGEEHG